MLVGWSGEDYLINSIHLTPATSDPKPEPVTSISVAALYSEGEAASDVGVLAALKV